MLSKSPFSAVPFSASGGEPAPVYALLANIRNTLYSKYTLAAPIRNTLYSTYILSVALRNSVIFPVYTLTAAIRSTVFAEYSLSADIRNTVNFNTYAISAAIRNTLFTPYSLAAQIRNTIQAPVFGNVWRAVIMLGGVDMSARLSGLVTVEMDEGSARIASFELMPFSGPIDPYDWIGAAVSIDYLTFNSQGAQQTNHRLFTGIVDEPLYDPVTKFTQFQCTDSLQEFFEQKSVEQIGDVLGGYYSEVVFSETDDRWQYAQQRLSTQDANFDFDVFGTGRLTSWAAKAVPDMVFSPLNIVHQSLGLKLISRRDVINTVNIKFGYRFGRKWQREIGGGWNYPRPFYQYLSDQTTLPNRDMVLNALDSGWDIKSIAFTKLPPSGQYTNAEGGQTTWNISEELRDYLVFGTSFTLAKKWLQDVTEDYSIQVTADASIAKHGVIKADEFYALDEEVDEEFEQVSEAATISSTSRTDSDIETGRSFGYTEPEAGGVSVGDVDTIVDPADRAGLENAFKAAIAEARARILRTHRNNTVVVQDLLIPTADTDKTASVVTDGVTAKGKIKHVKHTLNTQTGEAFSTVELSLYQPNITGQTDDAIVPPAQIDTTPQVSAAGLNLGTHIGGRTTVNYSPDWLGYIGNWTSARTFPSEWYPSEFRVDIPDIEDAARDAQEFAASSALNVAIPQDILTINA